MNKVFYGLLVVTAIVFLFVLVRKHAYQQHQVQVYSGDSFVVDPHCKHIALLGCTPHPTTYLKEDKNRQISLENIKIADFLEVDYLLDSFSRTILLCSQEHIDHLVIAYLPVHFIEMRELLGDQFISQCRMFLNRIGAEIKPIIEQTVEALGFKGNISLILPTDYSIERVPEKIGSLDERVRYLIKELPTLKDIANSSLAIISIINNKPSEEDDKLIDYLKYEYLYEIDHIEFRKYAIGKERFHQYTL